MVNNPSKFHKKDSGEALEEDASISLLRATLESTADGILVIDRDGQIAGYNEKFRNMWRIPKEVMDTGEEQATIQHVLDQLRDPDGYVKKLTKLYEEPDTDVFDEIEFIDGRIFERYSVPQ